MTSAVQIMARVQRDRSGRPMMGIGCESDRQGELLRATTLQASLRGSIVPKLRVGRLITQGA